ncbi:hypothetical protein [Rhodococcus zopfii]|uniref:hypothetical protein n=1 Tax=Rhodococcus zopfii TaxID=43772 RepID=UPI0011112DC9|nr:hypothetical protein [Rhodococcus zopfii]
MTVIIVARATNGFVVAADSRTCSGNLPYTIETDDAVKVRVHTFGSGGYVTASSGRAKINGQPIGEVEKRFIEEQVSAGRVPTPRGLARRLRREIKWFNLSHECECRSKLDVCVDTGECDQCRYQDEPEPDCPACATLRWTRFGFREDDCLCSPGEGRPADTSPPRYRWCRCTTEQEGRLDWVCVPFGPDRHDNPITVSIGPSHTKRLKSTALARFPHVQGELLSEFTDKFTVESETVEQAKAVATNGADANTKPLADTVDLVRELLITAYREGSDAAALRIGVALPSKDPEDRGPFTIGKVANAVRAGKKLDGIDIYSEVGDSSIGGPTRFITALDDGTTSEWTEAIPTN